MTSRRWAHHVVSIVGALASLGAAGTGIVLGEYVSAGFFLGLAVLFAMPRGYVMRVLGPFFIAAGASRIVEEILVPVSPIGIAVGGFMAAIGGWLVWRGWSPARGGWST